jgi:signal peptidase I
MSEGRRRIVHRVFDVFGLVAIVAVGLLLWPVSLGGSSRLIVVQGRSMEPTYHLGDLVLVRSNPSPDIGDVVLFEIGEGRPGAGSLVIHRVVGRADDGSYVTEGDNRETVDDFGTTEDDILGSPVIGIPRGGRLIGLASRPTTVGAAAGALAMLSMWPRTKRSRRDVLAGLRRLEDGLAPT